LVTVGVAGSSYNWMTVTNIQDMRSQGLTLGSGSSNNTVTVNAPSVWNSSATP
jgi:hypothetical protein